MANTPLTITLKLSPELDVNKINVLLRALKTSMGSLGRDIKLLDANQINAEMAKLTAATTQVKAGLTGAKTAADGLQASLQKAGNMKSLVGQAFGLNQMTMGLGALNAALDSFIQPFKELDKNVKDIGTLGRENFEEFSDMASELSTRIPESAAGIARGVYQAISASMQGSNQEIIDFVEVAASAATAGLSTTETAVNGFTSVLNAYGLKTKDVSDVSDQFFAAVKLGKTTFEEMNASLASYLPTAAALGVSFDQTTAGIVELTKQGTPTAQAGTQINAALLSIVKGNKFMVEGLKKSGMSLKELQENLKKPIEEGGGFVNTMRMIKVASEQSGIALTKMTGRAEGMKLIETMVGTEEKYTNALRTQNQIQEERAAHVADAAFQVARTSLMAGTFGNKMENVMHGVFKLTGDGFVKTLGILNKLMPAIMGFSILGPVFMKMAAPVVGLSATLMQKLIPSLFATAAAQKGVEAGTLGSAAAFKVLAKAMLTTPLGLLITGLAAAVAAYAIFHKSTEQVLDDNVKESQAHLKLIQQKKDLNDKQQQLAKSNVSLAAEYIRLGQSSKRSYEEQNRFEDLHRRLKASYQNVLGPSTDVVNNIEKLRKEMGLGNLEVEKATDQNRSLISRYEELSKKANLTGEEQKELGKITATLNTEFPGVIGSTKSFSGELELLKQKAGASSRELLGFLAAAQKIKKELAEATANATQDVLARAQNKIVGVFEPSFWTKYAPLGLMAEEEKQLYALQKAIEKYDKELKSSVQDNIQLVNAYERLSKKQKLSTKEQEEYDKVLTNIYKKFPFLIQSAEEWSKIKGEKVTPEMAVEFNVTAVKDKMLKQLEDVDIMTLLYSKKFLKFTTGLSEEDLNQAKEGAKEFKDALKSLYESKGVKIEVPVSAKDLDLGDDEAEAVEEETEAKKTAFELAKQQYDLDLKALDNKYKKIKADQEEKIAVEKRERTTQDDIELGLQKVDIDKEKVKLAEQLKKINLSDMKIKKGDDEVLDADKVKKTKKEIENIIDELNLELQDDETKQITLGTKLEKDTAKLIEDIAKLKVEIQEKEISNIKLKIEIETDPAKIKEFYSQLTAIYKSQLDKINADIAASENKISLLPDDTNEEQLKLQEAIKQLEDYYAKRAEIIKASTETEKEESEKKKIVLTEEQERYKQYALELTDALGTTMENIFTNQEAYGRALLLSMIDIVEKELMVAQLQALGTGIATMFVDPSALIKTLAIIAAIKVASSGLKAIAGSEEGDPSVGRTSTKKRGSTDKYLRWLAEDERVVTAKRNKQYRSIYDFLDAGGDPSELGGGSDVTINVKKDESVKQAVQKIVEIFHEMKILFKENLTPENFLRLANDYQSRSGNSRRFQNGEIPFTEYASKVRSFASGSPLLSSPTPAIIGDNPRFSEAVMLEPDIAAVGSLGANIAVSSMKKTMESLLSEMKINTNAVKELDGRFYVLERDVYEGTQRQTTKINRRIRT